MEEEQLASQKSFVQLGVSCATRAHTPPLLTPPSRASAARSKKVSSHRSLFESMASEAARPPRRPSLKEEATRDGESNRVDSTSDTPPTSALVAAEHHLASVRAAAAAAREAAAAQAKAAARLEAELLEAEAAVLQAAADNVPPRDERATDQGDDAAIEAYKQRRASYKQRMRPAEVNQLLERAESSSETASGRLSSDSSPFGLRSSESVGQPSSESFGPPSSSTLEEHDPSLSTDAPDMPISRDIVADPPSLPSPSVKNATLVWVQLEAGHEQKPVVGKPAPMERSLSDAEMLRRSRASNATRSDKVENAHATASYLLAESLCPGLGALATHHFEATARSDMPAALEPHRRELPVTETPSGPTQLAPPTSSDGRSSPAAEPPTTVSPNGEQVSRSSSMISRATSEADESIKGWAAMARARREVKATVS